MNRDRTTVSILAGINQEDYEETGQQAQDRDTARFEFNLRRDLSSNVYAEFGARYYARDYTGLDRQDSDLALRGTMGYKIGPAFNLSANYQFFQSNNNETETKLEENRIFVLLTYKPGWAR